MKTRYAIPAALGLLTFAAAAQDDHALALEKMTFEKMAPQVRVVGLQGGIMGKTIKGAPYAGVEVNETTQMLADGTRIHNESQTQVFRDSEGRLRRETPNEVTIWDPVANASWVLNPKTQTARKLPMGNFVYSTSRTGNGEVSTYMLRSATTDGPRLEESRVVEQKTTEAKTALAEAKIKAEIETHMRQAVGTAGVMVAAAGPNGDVVRRTAVLKQKM